MTENNEDVQLSPPTRCDNCGFAGVVLTTNATIHGKRCLAPDASVYHCSRCKASVGVHAGTRQPLGFMADSATRALRARAHNEFDPIWLFGRISRNKAYELLAAQLGLDRERCHIGLLAKPQLIQAIEFARSYKSEENKIKLRREAKKRGKQKQRAERDAALAKRKRDENRRQRANRVQQWDD